MADDKKNTGKKGLLRTLMQPLEKRLLLDASTLEATVNAIPSGILNLDAQDIDGDNDYSAGDQPTSGTTINAWEDKFGGNNDASQGTASRRPTYQANAFGTGIGGLVFDGNDTLDIGTQTGINASGPWPEKSFAVVFRTGADTSGFQVVYEQGGSIRGYQVSIDNGNIYAAGYNNTGSEWGADRFKVMNLGAVQANTTYRVIMVFDANTGNGYIKANLNGGDFVQLDEVGSQPNHTGAIGIGAEIGGTVQPSTLNLTNNTDTNFFKGSLGQIMLWNTALDDNQIRAVDSYLAHKWTNSPAIQFNTGDTVLEGGTTAIDNTELYTVDRNTPPSGLTYQITGLLNGNVQLSGVDVGIGGTFTQEDIDNGFITFVHDDSETTSANFAYRVTDGGSQDSDIFWLTVTPVDDPGDDPPAISTNTHQTVAESGSVNITSADLLVSDVDTAAASLTFTVTSTLNGSVFNTNLGAVVVSFTQADINSGFIRFDQDGTVNGFAGFDFDVTDGTTVISGTKDITVTFADGGGNDPPVIVTNTGDTVNTGGSKPISNTNLKTVDPDNTINQIVYTITNITNGAVTRNGANLGIGATFTQADINFGTIRFTHDGSATVTAGFEFDVSDGNTTVAGNTYDFNVVVNNAPNLGPDPAPVGLYENAANGFVVHTANATDPEFDAITYTIESGNGLGIFQINPINGQVTILDNTNLDFEAGPTTFNLVIRATDDGPGNPFDEYTLTINVQNVNEAPSGTDNTITANEDVPYTFAAGDFGFTDPDDTPANSLQSVIITTLPADGVLELSGVAVTAGQEISLANIPNLTFTSGADEFGAGYASFTFQVRDNGGTANGGVDLDSTPNTMTIDVNSVNDAPAGTDNTVTTNEDTDYTFAAGDFGFSDANDGPDNFFSVIITTLPADGVLELSGVAVTAGQEITVANIPNLTFTPTANEHGAGYASFTFQVKDDGGTANGGVNTDATPNTMTIDVNSVNDAPSGTDNTVTTNEDTDYTFAAGDFGFSDANDAPDNFLSVIITTLPASGVLELSGVAVTAGQEIALANIPNLTFTPVANENGAGYASFTFQVKDDGGTANGGIDTDATPNTMTIDVTSVNDAPAGTDNTVTTNEDIDYTFAAGDFGFSDVNDGPDNLFSVIITTLPATGVLELSGVAVTAGQEIAVADIPNLTFTPVANEHGAGYASFTFQVKDDGGTANGGVDTDATPNTMTIDVNSVNDAPAGADNTLSTAEDTPYTFGAGDFGFSDVNDAPDNFLSVIITTLPADGILELSGVAVTAGQEIALANIPNLTFTPTANEFGVGYTNFTFQVKDDGGTANGGIDTDQTPNTITFDVTSVNDAPAGTDNTVATNENTDYTFAAGDFGFSDANDGPDNFFSVIITTLPATGVLELSGVAVTAGQEIAVADIPNLTFTPVANEYGAGYADFTFQVKDDGGTANGGVDTDVTPNTMTIDVNSVNDEPAGADNTLSTAEDTPYTFAAGDFGFSDVNDAPDNFLSVIITTLPADGILELSGVAVTAGQEITVANIPNLTFTPTANEFGVGYTNFTFQVRDDGGTANGGIDTDQTPNTITFDVTSVNDAPEGTDNTVTTNEDTDYTFAAGDFGFSDVNDGPDNFFSVIITTLPATGVLELSGVAVTAGQEIAVADIPNLTFTPVANENGAGYTNFTFQVKDDGGTANGGIDTDATPNTMTIDVNSVNDEPAGTDNTVTTNEDTDYTFAAGDFGFSDVNDGPDNLFSVIITTLPATGVLELSGVAVTAGQEIAVADIPNLTFSPVANEHGAGYADFTFQVRDDGGTANGGVDTDQTPNTMTIDVNSVNDEPAGADNTLSMFENSSYTFASGDFGFSDVNDAPDNFFSVIITTLPADGVLELSGVAVTAGQEIAVADIPNLTFTPTSDENGVGYTNFTFQVKDDGGTANGGVDTDQTPNTITFDVDPINSEPVGTDNTVTTNEDTDYTFSAIDFGFTDPDDAPANTLQSVIITTLPAAGVLELSGVAVTAGQEIALADIPNLTFSPVANEHGAGYTDFTFQVRDDGGTANGGIDLDATPNTMTIDVNSVNDEPAGADNTLTTLEDTPYTFGAADFGFTDVNDAPDNFFSVIITTLPADGVLELSGVAVTAGQEIAVGDIPNLTFTPTANEHGASYTDFTFQVRDDGGTANGGVDTDQTPNTITFDVTSVNDEPDGTDNTVTTNEDTPYTFGAADFGFTDVNDAPNNLQSVIITTLPATGVLELSGVAVTAGQEIAVADIPNLTFTPVADENGAGYADFTFQVRDDGGTADGGVDLDATPNTITIDVTSVNDEPEGADNTITITEDVGYTFAAVDFGFNDPNDAPANNLQAIIINTLPANGVLELSGVAVTAGQSIAAGQIANLTYTAPSGANGLAYDTFNFSVQDDGGTANGGVDTDQTPNTITFDIDASNDAPEGTDNTVSTLENNSYTFGAGDFGFADPNDTPSNNFFSVIITTLPADGILELSGVAVTAGQEIALADIPNLTFTPAVDENGVGYTNFTFQVKDDGGTANGGVDIDQTPNTMTIDVTSVNDAPEGTDNTLTTLEDTPYTFGAGDFGFTDPDDTPANALQSVIITTLPASGVLELSGVAVTAGQEIAVADIPNLTFTPTLNEYGAGYTDFTFQVRDDGGTADGGIDLDPTPNTITFDVTQVNDAPDGTDNTLTTLEDTPYTFGAGDFGFTDPDDAPANALQSVIITTLPASGILELSGVAVTAGQEIAVADIPNLTFTPAAHENGAGYTDFTFQVRDDGGTADGGVDLDGTPNTITFDVTSVNDEPDGTDNTVTTLEDTDYVFDPSDFGFTDVNDAPDNLQSVIITTLPATGVLELSGVAVVAGQEIAVADIPNLTFTPVTNEHGAGYTDFTFQVRDDGGTADGGVDLDSTPNTMTIDVTSVNDEPEGTDNTVTALEDTPLTFNAADFGFTDPIDTPANALQSVIITTLPADGILELSGVAVVAGQEIALADIPNLTFTPAAHEYGAGYTNFTFQVRDDGGTADGGIDLDPTPNTMTIDVTEVNDAPEGTDATLNVLENNVYTFGAGDFGFTDPNDAPIDALQSVIITTLPVSGVLELSGVAVTAGQEIALADIPNLTFTPVANENGVGYTDFTFQVRDDGSTADGGIDLDPTPNTITFDVDPINSEPYGADNTVTTLEDTDYTFDPADFGFSDPDDIPSNILQSVIITTLPATGVLELSGVAVVAGQEITVADIPNLTFSPVANENGASYTDFTFQVRDDGGTANGGVDLDATPNTMTIDVTSVNDEPDGADNTLTTLEDTPYTFAAGDFGFSDVNDAPNNLLSVIITTLPASGVLELSGVAVTAGQEIAVADIPNLTFTPAAHEYGAGYTDFTFQVRDDDGTADGGVDTDQTPNTITFDVTEVNDAPEGTDTTVTTLEDTDYVFNAADFGFTDPNDNPVDNFQSVIITTLPATGVLELSGVAVVAGQEITVADIPNLTFTPVANENGAGYADFTFQVRDDGGTADGGIDLDGTPNTMTIDVTSVNDEPDGTDNTLTTLEDTPYNFDPADFGLTDPDDVPANSLSSVIITTLPADGILELSGVAVTAGQEIAVADIPNLTFTPTLNEYGAGYTDFTFQVRDDDGTADGGIDLDSTPNTITFDVTQVNDAPEGADNTLTTLEDTPLTFNAADFGFTDPNDAPVNNFFSVIITTLPANGVLELSGVAVTAGQEIAVADIPNLTFTPDLHGNGAGYTDFTFQVKDDGGTADTGVDTDQTPNTMTIDVTPVNDEPDGTDTTVTTLEDTDYIFDPADFGFTDVNDAPDNLQSVIITTLPATGVLELSGVAVVAGQEIAVADIPNLTFSPVANENGAGYADFTFQVRDDGGTANGGVDLDATPNTITIDVTSVNDAPAGADNTVTTLEDTSYFFDATDFGFTDPDELIANNFQSVIITTLPVDGVLELSGVAVTAGQEIALADIPNLAYVPADNDNGLAAADFTFQVKDDGGTADGGIDTDQTPNTMTIDITSVNDAPDGTDTTLNMLESAVHTFAAGDFGFTDPDELVANNFQSVIITTLPANGILELSGVAVVAGQEIALADIPNLTFTPPVNENGIGYTDFTFQVRDDGGTADGGIDTDQTPNTITFDVQPINSAPHGTDNTVTTLEDTDYVFDPADFGFNDVDDIPADNNFLSVFITTLPATGVLELSGVAVVAGQEIAVADIPNLTFTPVADENGAGYTSFTFQVRDDGGTGFGAEDTDQTPNTMTIDVTSVNDEPEGTDNTLTTLEDTPYTFGAGDFGFTDPNDSPVNNLLSVIITTLPADGVLELSGVAVVAGQEIAVADIPNLTYTPGLHGHGAGYTDFTFQVRDDDGTANGGVDTDQTPNTITFDVTEVNDAPEGTDNTVTTLEDTDYVFDPADFGFTDPNDNPVDNLQSVIITTLPATGVLELSGVAVVAGQEIAVADIPNLTFTPVANENGAGYADFTFQVRDDGGTANGGIDLDPTPNTMTIDVTSVNDAPAGADNTLSTLEDTPYNFNPADFGFTDPDDLPANSLQSIVITTLPANGILELSGFAVTAGQAIALVNIPNLTFTPSAHEFGVGYTDFTFQVRDDGGTADGGIDTDQTPNTITFDVTQVNDDPEGTDNTVTTLEDTAYTFAAGDFGFTDPNDIPANNFVSVIITTLPADGVLELSGVAVTAGQEIALADIPNLTFMPDLNGNGPGYTDFTFQVRDDGGTVNGGIEVDQTPNTMTIDVTPVDDPPILDTNAGMATFEGFTEAITPAMLSSSDVDTDPADIIYTLTSAPVNGQLELVGTPGFAIASFTQDDIDNNRVVYVHDSSETIADSFDFEVSDATTNIGGATFNIAITPVNDAPEGTDNTVTALEDVPYTFNAADFGFSDPNDIPPDSLASIIITTLPANGTLAVSGVPVFAGQEVTLANIPNLTFTTDPHGSGIGYTDFTFQVKDDGGIANGGVDTDQTPNTMTIDVTEVNDAPEGTDTTLNTLENNVYTFGAGDFGFTDLNDVPADNLQSVIINTLPADGILELSGVAVTAGQEIALADIPNLTFTPDFNENGVGYASFTFQVRDDGGTADGGINLDPTPNTITFDVGPVNSSPHGTDNTLTTLEDTPLAFDPADFGFNDVDDLPDDNALFSVIISTLPADGVLQLSGVPVFAGQEILVADIPNLTFTPDLHENGAGYTNFTFQVKDDGGLANGGADTDTTPNTMTIDVTPVNDAPEGTDNTVTALEDVPFNFNAADFGFSDPNDIPANTMQSVIISTLPANGELRLSGVAVVAGQEIPLANIPNLTFITDPHGNGAGYTTFTFQVRDNGGTADGGVDIDQTPNTMTVDVTPVNDAPEGTDNTVTALEDTPMTFNAADFGFTDPNDLPANVLQSVVITTLPADGILELSGVAVVAGQEIALADIPNLTFTAALNENGAGYTDFTFQLRDNGGTANGGVDLDPTPNTMTIDVTPVNDEPSGTDNTLTTYENGAYIFDASDFGFSDVIDGPDNFLSVIITTLPADGILRLSNVPVLVGQEILVTDLPNLTFRAAADESGIGYTSFTFQVRDDGGTANGGIDTDQTPNTITFDVSPANSAPDGTDNTVTALEDVPFNFIVADFGFTDPGDTPPNTMQSVIITTLPADGILELSGAAVTAGQEISIFDIPNLTFTSGEHGNGIGYTSFTFQVRDNGGTADGGIDIDQIPNTMTIDVTPVNDAPEGTDRTVTTLEDTSFFFTPATFGFTDPNDIPANSLASVVITTLPADGILELSGVAVTAGQEIALADLGNLVYTPPAHANGAAYTDFTFQVRDDGGTVNGGVDLDQTPNTITIDITPINDAPAGTDTTLTIVEDDPYSFSAANFGFSDVNDAPDNFQSVVITTLPVEGILRLSGVAVFAGQEISVTNLPNLTFTPDPGDSGLGYTSFTFQVRDDGGTAIGGQNTDQTPNTITFDVVPANDPPEGADNTATILEDSSYTFAAGDFGFSDAADTPPHNFQSVIITTLPVNGALELSGVAVTAGQEIAVADIPNLVFTPVANENGIGYDNFTFQVKDDGGTLGTGLDTDQTPNTFTFDVLSVNDEPAGADNTLTTDEDIPYTFAAGDFGFSDANDGPDNLLSVIITTLPADGILELSGVAVIAGQEIAAADIPNLTFTPAANENGLGYASFTFQVRDDGGTANGGIDTDQTPNTITFDVTPVDDGPEGTDNTVTTLEDVPYTFNVADFGFTDPEDTPPDNFLSVVITTLPADGILELSGVAVVAGQEITVADIPNLVFTPDPDGSGAGYADFTFQVRDDSGAVDLDPTPNTMTIDVTDINDEPEGTDATLTAYEDTPYNFNVADFGLTDPNDNPDDGLQSVIITTLPATGTLELSGVAVVAGQEIAAADIPNLTFTPLPGEFSPNYADFTFQVRDDGGTANGGINLDATPNTITFDVDPINDAPEGTDNTLTTEEDTPLTFSAADFGFSDPNDTPSNGFQSVIITTLPADGILELSGVAVIAGQEITVADIPNLTFTPDLGGSGLGYTDFTFQVRDNGGTANGGVDTDQSPNTITIDVAPINDAPEGTDNTVTTNEDTDYVFNAADFGFTDPNDVPANTLQSVIITTLPVNGVLELSGVAVVAGQEISVADIPNLTFSPLANEHGAGYADFTFQVRDNGGTANGGVDLDPTPNTMTIDVNSVNDAPEGTDNTITTLEDTDYTFNAGDFGFSDPVDVPANALQSVIITTLPADGVLELSGVAVVAGQEIAVADIPNLTFTPDPDGSGAGYADFTFQVKDNGGTANGGVDTDPTPNTITIDVTPVDDPPVLDINAGMATFEGATETITTAMLSTSDVDTDPSDIIYTITSAPVNGQLELVGAPGVAIASFTQDDLDNNRVVYVHDSSETVADSFDFDVSDGTTNLGASTFNIAITLINDAPQGADNTLVTPEDTPYTFNAGDFGFSDPNDLVANNLQSVIITTLPSNGVLELSGVAVVAGQEIAVADIPNLTFTPSHNGNGVGYADFTFQVKDDGGTANGGVDTDQTPNTITFDVIPVNDAPHDLALSAQWFAEGMDSWNVGTIQGYDVDGPALTYSIVGGHPDFSITGGNILTMSGSKLWGVDPDTYQVTLRVNDGALTYDETFTITLFPQLASMPDIVNPAEAFTNNDTSGQEAATLSPVKDLQFYIRDFLNEIRNGDLFRYGSQGFMDSALALSDGPMKDIFYGDGVIDEIIKKNIITKLQELAFNINETSGVSVNIAQLAEIFGLDVLLLEMQGADSSGDSGSDHAQDDVVIYETNAIYKALMRMNGAGDGGDGAGDELAEEGIAEQSKQSQRQYLHLQLDEAALYYKSKHEKLTKALKEE